LNALKRRPIRAYNGASMIGLAGVIIKSHGGADRVAFANAVLIVEARRGVPHRSVPWSRACAVGGSRGGRVQRELVLSANSGDDSTVSAPTSAFTDAVPFRCMSPPLAFASSTPGVRARALPGNSD
jgi:hypothetical protein